MKEINKALKIREKQKRKMPDFVRADSWKVKRLEDSGWRRPKGLDTKMRLKRKGWPPIVNIGYRKIKKARYLHPSGLMEVIVHNAKEVEKLDKNKHIIRIAASVGKKKRLQILDIANKLGIKVANPVI